MDMPKKIVRALYLFKNRIGRLDRCAKKNKQYEARKDEWMPLTKEEKKWVSRRKDTCYYALFKNLAGLTKENAKYYVTDFQYENEILPRLNPFVHPLKGGGSSYCSLFADKNYYEMFMPEFKQPKTVLHVLHNCYYDKDFNKLDKESAIALLNSYEKLVFKQSRDSSCGNGVRLIEKKDYEKAIDTFADNFIVQEIVKQCPEFAYYNDSSVNVLRITSVLWNGTVYILTSSLRVGAPGAFCDHCGYKDDNPYQIPILEDGTYEKRALEADTLIFHDNVFGKEIKGKVPGFKEMIEKIKKAHLRYPDYGIIGWDLTVDDEGDIVLIEYNVVYPAFVGIQYQMGPALMKKTVDGNYLYDEIMSKPLDYKNQPCM